MFNRLAQKYWKPNSLTWLAACIPLLAGLFMAFEPVHGLTTYVEVVSLAFGGVTPLVLINTGLGAIGFRGAIK